MKKSIKRPCKLDWLQQQRHIYTTDVHSFTLQSFSFFGRELFLQKKIDVGFKNVSGIPKVVAKLH